MLQILIVIVTFAVVSLAGSVDMTSDPPEYGVDCSYPIHYGINKQACPYFYDQYNKMMQGCYKLYSKSECEQNERERMNMSREQPATQHNYTAIGFKKLRAPKAAWEPLIEFYNQNKDKRVLEKWYRGATIVNTWDSPTYMVSFENPSFRGGSAIKNQIWEGVRPVIEEWVGRKIVPTSLYGVRLYSDKSVLATRKSRSLCTYLLLHS
ncbi:hypothetical protein EON65_18150 [archaeon]|nr:MAG: hypothetical protein EON65_18150 [archaeon]